MKITDLRWGAAAESVDADWSALYDSEGLTFAEAFDYDDYRHDDFPSWTLIATNHSTTHVLWKGRAFELDDDVDREDLLEAVGRKRREWLEDGGGFDHLRDLSPSSWGSEGPMMSYWYPCPSLECDADTAAKIEDLPLCVVEVNGTAGLALTGGGMDLSWEVAEAFVRLGYFPPAFIASLPWYAGQFPLSRKKRKIVNALIERNTRERANLAYNNRGFRAMLDQKEKK